VEIAGEEVLLEFAQYLTNKAESEVKHEAMCLDLSNKWFTLLHSTRPFIIHEIHQLADQVTFLI
jgi:poly [ADP-ribose] polymerase